MFFWSSSRRRTTSLFAAPEGSASLRGHMLAPAAPGGAAAHRTPPQSPTSQRRLVPSPALSPSSRHILDRLRVKGQESRFRTPQQSGELDMHLPQKKRGEHKRSRRRHNRAAVEWCDPTPAPPQPPPAEVMGDVGRPRQDRVSELPPTTNPSPNMTCPRFNTLVFAN